MICVVVLYYLFCENWSVCAVPFSKPISGSSDQQKQQQQQQAAAPPGWLKIFTVAAYQPYFDVDTSDILARIKDSFFPFKGTFSQKTATTPDL